MMWPYEPPNNNIFKDIGDASEHGGEGPDPGQVDEHFSECRKCNYIGMSFSAVAKSFLLNLKSFSHQADRAGHPTTLSKYVLRTVRRELPLHCCHHLTNECTALIRSFGVGNGQSVDRQHSSRAKPVMLPLCIFNSSHTTFFCVICTFLFGSFGYLPQLGTHLVRSPSSHPHPYSTRSQ